MFPSTSSFWTRSRPSAISRLRRNSSHVAGASPIPRPRPASLRLCESEDRLVASCHRPDDRSHPLHRHRESTERGEVDCPPLRTSEPLALLSESGRILRESPSGPYRELLHGEYRVIYRVV